MRRFGAIIDEVRLLHTPQLEHRALVVMLRLRATGVLLAPLLSPLAGGSGAAWALAAAWGSGTALVADRLGNAVMDPEAVTLRRGLLAVETPGFVAALVVTGSWPVALLAAGPINWVQRPRWRPGAIVAWLALVSGALAVSGSPQGPALLVLACITSSYGLMAPRAAGVALQATVAWVRDRVGVPITVTVSTPARQGERMAWTRRRRPATLGELLSQAVATAAPPGRVDGVAFDPERLAAAPAGPGARDLERAVKEVTLLCARQSDGTLTLHVTRTAEGDLWITPAVDPAIRLRLGPGTRARLRRQLASSGRGRLQLDGGLAVRWQR